jgi:hypothetical protein
MPFFLTNNFIYRRHILRTFHMAVDFCSVERALWEGGSDYPRYASGGFYQLFGLGELVKGTVAPV